MRIKLDVRDGERYERRLNSVMTINNELDHAAHKAAAFLRACADYLDARGNLFVYTSQAVRNGNLGSGVADQGTIDPSWTGMFRFTIEE